MPVKQTSQGTWRDSENRGNDLLASVRVIGRYVEARLADRVLYADEILKYEFCLNVIKTSLCPLEVLKNMQEAVRDDDIVFSGLPSTEPF
ncbi:hypothetical protein Bca101_024569 [Brassica carinata]